MRMITKNMRADAVKAERRWALILEAHSLATDAAFSRPCRGAPSGELIEVG